MSSFPKQEKLCGQLRIAALYKEGRRFVSFPLRVTVRTYSHDEATLKSPLDPLSRVLWTHSSSAIQVLIWAPKSLFKHAVDRNHLRRLMREAYRMEKAPLEDYCQTHNCHMELALNYMDKMQHDLPTIQRAIRKAIKKLTENTNKQD